METDTVVCALRPGCSVAGPYLQKELWPEKYGRLARIHVAAHMTLHVNAQEAYMIGDAVVNQIWNLL